MTVVLFTRQGNLGAICCQNWEVEFSYSNTVKFSFQNSRCFSWTLHLMRMGQEAEGKGDYTAEVPNFRLRFIGSPHDSYETP